MYRTTYYTARGPMSGFAYARLRFCTVWGRRIDAIAQRVAREVLIGFSLMIIGISLAFAAGIIRIGH